ncbi:MAG: hypothetical protein WC091_19330, partial [Sulfuricellaceae bacterium]
GLKGNRLQIRLDGPYFTDFLVNRMAIDQKIGEICPRPAEFLLRFFKSDRLLALQQKAGMLDLSP